MKKLFVHFILHTICWLLLHSIVCLQGDDILPFSSSNLSSPSPDGLFNLSSSENEEVALHEHVDTNENPYTNTAHLHSSFEEAPENTVIDKVLHFESASQNTGIATEFSNGGQGIIFNVGDTATAELHQKAAIPSAASHKVQLDYGNVSTNEDIGEVPVPANITDLKLENRSDDSIEAVVEEHSSEPKDNLTLKDTPEDIPSFSEWTQKQLEEAEKKRIQDNSSVHQHTNGKLSSGAKLRSKNYASPDCGAKIVATNPEAVSPNSVLTPSRDEYKLNACTNRIWFIVELCEAVQAKRIDLANFELFSSSPKDFTVSVSDRFPSREWSVVGQFTAKDERDMQSFDLSPHLFGKYIKVEVKSHYGSEHFCPISLFRVYGTSEFEVLEKEDQANAVTDDDDDETLDSGDSETSKNLLSSATDAVISIVKKAAEVLGNKPNVSNQTDTKFERKQPGNYSLLVSTCTTPAHYVVCDNCSDTLFGNVYELVSCRSPQLKNMLAIPYIKDSVSKSGVCSQFGLEFNKKQTSTIAKTDFVRSFFPVKYVAALCNTIAVTENMVVLNSSAHHVNETENTTYFNSSAIVNVPPLDHAIKPDVNYHTDALESPDLVDKPPQHKETPKNADPSQIKPTKTVPSSSQENVSDTTLLTHSEPEFESSSMRPTDSITLTNGSDSGAGKTTLVADVEKADSVENLLDSFENVPESLYATDEQLDISEVNVDNSQSSGSHPTSTTVGTAQVQSKESVFLRLSNRIKALERNMSLSTQYLEELSRRYKKQVEEIQRVLDKTVTALNAESKRKEERNERLEERIRGLEFAVETLVAERSKWSTVACWLCFVVVVVAGLGSFWWRVRVKQPEKTEKVVQVRRRKSVDVITHNRKPKKKRRPSEEALTVRGTYEHLLIVEPRNEDRSESRKFPRKRKKSLYRSNSVTTLTEESESSNCGVSAFQFRPTSSCKLNQAPALDWVESNVICRIQEPPLPLDESEHTFLEKLDYKDECAGVDNIQSAPELLNAVNKSSHNGQVTPNTKKEHKKSASVDETRKLKIDSTLNGGSVSLTGSFEDPKPLSKKEKKGGLKRIFKKVF